MDNINVRITDNFIELTPKEGYCITDWNGENIEEFSATTMIACPNNFDISAYHSILAEDAQKLEEEKIEIISKKEKEQHNND